MANRSSRDPGTLRNFEGTAQIADTPDAVVEQGQIFRTLASLGGGISQKLKVLADDAARREGELAGLTAGQRAGAGYVERRQTEAVAHDHAVETGELTVRSGDVDGVNEDVLARFTSLQQRFGNQLPIVSGYRDPARNAAAGGARRSQHMHGNALDIDVASFSQEQRTQLIEMASAEGFTGIGVYNNSLHFDLGGRRAWGPSYGRESVPGWASSAIARHLAATTGTPAAGGDVPAAFPQPATGGLNAQPLALRNDGSIRGEAFDRAAMNSYGWRMQQGITTDLGAAYEQFKDDPAGFSQAVAGIREQYTADDIFQDPRIREVFEQSFSQKSQTYAMDVSARHERRLLEEQAAAVGEGLAAQQLDLERQAYLLGANPDGEAILAGQTDRVLASINSAVADDILTPAQGADRRAALAQSVSYGRINGVFAALDSPAQQQAFATGLLDQWASGEGPGAALSFNQVKALSQTLYSQATQAQNQITAESRVEASRLSGLLEDDIASMGATGRGLDTPSAGLDPARVELLLGEDELIRWQAQRDFARQSWEATAGMDMELPGEISDRLLALEPVPGSEGFVQQQEIYQAAAARASEVLTERETDPLGQAMRAGAIALEPIDTTSMDGLTGSLALRRQQAQAVSDMYGTPVTIFRPAERAALASGMIENPQLLPAFAANVVETFGPLAPRALSELSETGPELAHAAGIAMVNGDTSVAEDVARVLSGRAAKTINITMPSDAVMSRAAGAIIGPAMAVNEGTRSAVTNLAGILFEQQAAAMGFDPADVNEPGSAAHVAYQRSLNRALGASTVNGVQYGGMASVNGTPVVAPTFMPADRLQSLVQSLSPDALAGLPPIASGNGIDIRAEDLRGGKLIAVGDGQYRVALGDPFGLEPRFVTTPEGDYWVLDAQQLESVANRTSRPTFGAPSPTSRGGYAIGEGAR